MAKKLSPDVQAMISATDAGMHLTSIALANKILAQDSGNIRVLLDLGHACTQLARYEQAENAYQTALELSDPTKRDVVYGELGNLNRARGDFAAAAQWYQKQIDTDPADSTGYLFLGSLLFRQGQLIEAKQILVKGLDCTMGRLDEIHFTLGLVLSSQNDFEPADYHFQKALKFDPDYSAAKTARKDLKSANSLTRQGNDAISKS